MAKELLKGNVAIAEAAVRAGCQAYFGYPITPQTELLEHMAARMGEEGWVVMDFSVITSFTVCPSALCNSRS